MGFVDIFVPVIEIAIFYFISELEMLGFASFFTLLIVHTSVFNLDWIGYNLTLTESKAHIHQ